MAGPSLLGDFPEPDLFLHPIKKTKPERPGGPTTVRWPAVWRHEAVTHSSEMSEESRFCVFSTAWCPQTHPHSWGNCCRPVLLPLTSPGPLQQHPTFPVCRTRKHELSCDGFAPCFENTCRSIKTRAAETRVLHPHVRPKQEMTSGPKERMSPLEVLLGQKDLHFRRSIHVNRKCKNKSPQCFFFMEVCCCHTKKKELSTM